MRRYKKRYNLLYKKFYKERDDFKKSFEVIIMKNIFNKNRNKIFASLGTLLITSSVSLSMSVTSFADDGLKDIDFNKAMDTASTDALVGCVGATAFGAITGGLRESVIGGYVGFVGCFVEGAIRSVIEDIRK